ncbi:MAG: hypothetical protein JO111_12960 [Caulobacteraceae bacterium]|nr:hypothetical protein [Caulobacteraceae bacterium]
MTDVQAIPAGMGEAARAAPAPNAPYPGAGLGGPGLDAAPHADDPAQVHASIAAAPPEQQAVILQRLRLIDQIAQAIRGQTNEPLERARMAQHIAQTHPEMGIDPGMLTPQAMSDENIAALHHLMIEAAVKVALANLPAKAATGVTGVSSQSVRPGVPVGTDKGSAVRTFAPPASRTSHAAQGFTILGVER